MDGYGSITARAKAARNQRGVTMIELLVTLSVLAFAATIIIINAPPAREGPQREAERFSARLYNALDAAMVQSAPKRLEVSPQSYAISEFHEDEWRVVKRYEINTRVFFSVETDDLSTANSRALGGAERLGVSSDLTTVRLDPLSIGPQMSAHFQNNRAHWTVVLSPAGEIRIERQ